MEYNMNVHKGMQFGGWPDFYISYVIDKGIQHECTWGNAF